MTAAATNTSQRNKNLMFYFIQLSVLRLIHVGRVVQNACLPLLENHSCRERMVFM